MDLSERNRKVAISRWSKVHQIETDSIKKSPENNFLKARLCGFLAGDGSIMVRKDNRGDMHYVLRFFPDHPSLIESFSESLMKVYGKTPIVKKDPGHNGVICYSKIVVNDLLETGKFGIDKWRVPFSILEDDRSKMEWLRAFFDSEGYVGKSQIKVQTVNKMGMADVGRLLSHFGIKFGSYVYRPKNDRWSDVHILVIGSKEERRKFLNIIGFNHTVKLRKLQNAQVA